MSYRGASREAADVTVSDVVNRAVNSACRSSWGMLAVSVGAYLLVHMDWTGEHHFPNLVPGVVVPALLVVSVYIVMQLRRLGASFKRQSVAEWFRGALRAYLLFMCIALGCLSYIIPTLWIASAGKSAQAGKSLFEAHGWSLSVTVGLLLSVFSLWHLSSDRAVKNTLKASRIGSAGTDDYGFCKPPTDEIRHKTLDEQCGGDPMSVPAHREIHDETPIPETPVRVSTSTLYRRARELRELNASVRGGVPSHVMWAKRQGECVYCGNPARTADHIRPLVLGGWHDPDNLVPACHSCNASKGAQLLVEWYSQRKVNRACSTSSLVACEVLREMWGDEAVKFGVSPMNPVDVDKVNLDISRIRENAYSQSVANTIHTHTYNTSGSVDVR